MILTGFGLERILQGLRGLAAANESDLVPLQRGVYLFLASMRKYLWAVACWKALEQNGYIVECRVGLDPGRAFMLTDESARI